MARLPTTAKNPSGDISFSPKSSFIENAAYSAKDQTLTLTFKSGSQYAYQNVSPATWLNFQASPDHSSYYANAIKGRLSAEPVRESTVGTKKSNPLQKVSQTRNLNEPNGNVQRQGIQRIERTAGLIPEELLA